MSSVSVELIDEISGSEPLDVNLSRLHATLQRLVPLFVDEQDSDAEQRLIRLVLSFDTVYDRFTSWNALLANSFSVMKHRKCISLLLSVLKATQNCELAAPVLGTLRCLARVDRNKSYIVERNGVPIITTVLLFFISHSYRVGHLKFENFFIVLALSGARPTCPMSWWRASRALRWRTW
jgi:hypothetical protein